MSKINLFPEIILVNAKDKPYWARKEKVQKFLRQGYLLATPKMIKNPKGLIGDNKSGTIVFNNLILVIKKGG